VTEDAEQVQRILAGIVGFSNLNIKWEQVRLRMHIVEAVRLDPAFVATVGVTYREQFTRNVEGVEELPLVVLDTKSAVLAVENESDNAEASRMMAALKQGFDGLPIWLIGHVAKAILNRNDLASLSSRGASAIEGDANQTMFLVRDGDIRFLILGKVRFEPKWHELQITSHTATTTGSDEFGNSESIVMRWGIAGPAHQTRKEASKQAAELQRKEDDATRRQEVRDAVETAWQLGNPLNVSGVKAKIGGNSSAVGKLVENLLNEQWLIEVPVPRNVRIVNSKDTFLVSLTTEEHEAVLSGRCLSVARLAIPASWQKPAIALVPECVCEPVNANPV
jgi:hypothetical protein